MIVRECLEREGVTQALAAAGSEGIAHFGRTRVFVFLPKFIWARRSCRATNWQAVLATAFWTVEGYRTPN